MIGQHKRSLEHCLSFQPVKCMKQSEALTCKSRCETKAEDEEVLLDAHVDDDEHDHDDQQLCFEESLCPLESSKETTKDSSSQEHSSLELCCPLQESSASSPAPIRYYHLQVKKVPVGPEHQADVPDWDPCTGPVRGCTGEDIKWYGVKLWPLEGQEKRGEVAAVVGRGRREACGCLDSGSIDCVRRHVAEERHRVRDELGPMLFDKFGFNDMGECVSEHWSDGEERTFGELVKLNPASLGRDFWSQLATAFPSRSSLELVSYYFNVFVLRRRALQNRFDPEHADSDDDETELVDSEVDEDWEQHIEDEDEEVEERGVPGYHHQCIQDEDLVEDDDDEGPRWEDEEEEEADEEEDQDGHLDQHQDHQHQDEDHHHLTGMLQDHRSSFHEQHRELSSESYLKELGGGPGAVGADWMGPVDWHHHHQASLTAGGIGALELASTHGAMQELFGEEDGGAR